MVADEHTGVHKRCLGVGNQTVGIKYERANHVGKGRNLAGLKAD